MTVAVFRGVVDALAWRPVGPFVARLTATGGLVPQSTLVGLFGADESFGGSGVAVELSAASK